MTHSDKVDRLVRELTEKGVARRTAAPPAFRLLWALGSEIPPPLFISFERLTLLFGAVWGILYAVGMWVLLRRRGVTLVGMLWPTSIASVFVGITVAGYFRWKAWKLNLPDWKDYGTVPGEMSAFESPRHPL